MARRKSSSRSFSYPMDLSSILMMAFALAGVCTILLVMFLMLTGNFDLAANAFSRR